MNRSDEDQADDVEQPEDRAVSWGPTFGPETEADRARPLDREPAHRGWHPPGGPW